MVTKKKTDGKYDTLSADDKKKFDEMITKMIEKKAEKAGELKMAAGFTEMTTLEKDMFDKVLLAQWKVDKESMEKRHEKIDLDGMTKEAFAKLTDAEKKAKMDKMKGMKEMLDEKVGEREKKDMEFKKKVGYFTTMTKDERDLFDKKMDERKGRMDEDMSKHFEKFQEGKKEWDSMSDDDKKKAMSDKMEMMKMKQSRDQTFSDHDFSQRIKMGYFDKMNSSERKNFDDSEKSMRDERKGNFGKMDGKM